MANQVLFSAVGALGNLQASRAVREAYLTDTSAQNCDFQSAQSNGSDIRNVDLSTSNLVNADLHKVKYDSRTIFPDGYPIPSDAVDMVVSHQQAEEFDRRLGCFLALICFGIITIGFFAIARSP